MIVNNAANIRARFHGPTDTRPGRWVLSWRGKRLGVIDSASCCRDGAGRADQVLARIAAARLCAWHMSEYPDATVTADSVTVSDAGPSDYSIHVVTRWA
jgi:hypothetical protein